MHIIIKAGRGTVSNSFDFVIGADLKEDFRGIFSSQYFSDIHFLIEHIASRI